MAATPANATNETSTGIQSFDGTATFNGRTITGTANQISVSNGDGTGGNPTLSLTSTIQVSGISFDSGSNTLSHYTQGTFSPTWTGASTTGTSTYSQQTGNYTRIGNQVTLYMQIIGSAATGTGNVNVGAYPFTVNASATSGFGACFMGNNSAYTWTASTTSMAITAASNNTVGNLASQGSGANFGNMTIRNAAWNFSGTVSYLI